MFKVKNGYEHKDERYYNKDISKEKMMEDLEYLISIVESEFLERLKNAKRVSDNMSELGLHNVIRKTIKGFQTYADREEWQKYFK